MSTQQPHQAAGNEQQQQQHEQQQHGDGAAWGVGRLLEVRLNSLATTAAGTAEGNEQQES
jgi:hypothetical protein